MDAESTAVCGHASCVARVRTPLRRCQVGCDRGTIPVRPSQVQFDDRSAQLNQDLRHHGCHRRRSRQALRAYRTAQGSRCCLLGRQRERPSRARGNHLGRCRDSIECRARGRRGADHAHRPTHAESAASAINVRLAASLLVAFASDALRAAECSSPLRRPGGTAGLARICLRSRRARGAV